MHVEFDPYYKWLGIQLKDQPPNYYRLLGIELFESDQNVIASAANQRYVYIRSFQTGEYSTISQKILDEITVAGKCLLNRKQKEIYDHDLKCKLYGLEQEQNDCPNEPMSFVKPIRTSNIIKNKNIKQQTQIGSAIIGILLIAGIVVTAFSIYNNLNAVSDTTQEDKTANHISATRKKTADSHSEKKYNDDELVKPDDATTTNFPKSKATSLPIRPEKSPGLPKAVALNSPKTDADSEINLKQQTGSLPLSGNDPPRNSLTLKDRFNLSLFDIDTNLLVDSLK